MEHNPLNTMPVIDMLNLAKAHFGETRFESNGEARTTHAAARATVDGQLSTTRELAAFLVILADAGCALTDEAEFDCEIAGEPVHEAMRRIITHILASLLCADAAIKAENEKRFDEYAAAVETAAKEG